MEWRIKAVHLGTCNCAYGCPCKFHCLADPPQLPLGGRVFSAMCPNKLEPLFLPISDLESTHAQFAYILQQQGVVG